MRYSKGQSGNPSGRPKGAKNKASGRLAGLVATIVDNNMNRIQKDLDSLEPQDRIRAIVSLMGYVIPKKQAINVQQSLDYEYEKLNDENIKETEAIICEQLPKEGVKIKQGNKVIVKINY